MREGHSAGALRVPAKEHSRDLPKIPPLLNRRRLWERDKVRVTGADRTLGHSLPYRLSYGNNGIGPHESLVGQE